MPKTKQQKQKIAEGLSAQIKNSPVLYFVDFTGIKNQELSDVKKQIRVLEGNYEVIKKTLLSLALANNNLDSSIVNKFNGPVALISGVNEIELAKIISKFSKAQNKFQVLGGLLENNFIGTENVIALASIPSKEALLGRTIATIGAPLNNLVYSLKFNLIKLVGA